MKRYNIFNQVHKGLRALLYETALAVQQCDFLSEADTEKTLKQVREVLELFDRHAHTEDKFILPAISEYEPAVVAAFEDEHKEDHEFGSRLKELLNLFEGLSDAAAKVDTGNAIYQSLVKFMIFNLGHMAKEEDILNKLLWRYYTDDQLKKITQQIVSGQPVDTMVLYSKWMMRGLNNAEIVNWLKDVKNKAPHFVFEGLMTISKNELDHRRWLILGEQLAEGAMVA